MSYQVIARKWRSQNFSELVGQTHITQTLMNALKSDRLPHAFLFTGPRGTGKTSTARILAKSLRCPNAKDFDPCGKCRECEDIANGRAVDVIEIDGASNNGVDAIRELRESVGYMPSSGKFKIYIIDEVHMLSGSAFNALLKTLEEPPEHVIFIMATTEVQKIPNTILSRCQRYDFRRISTRLIADHLKHICDKEGIKTDNEALWAIARQGDGSMRDSQSLLDQAISFSGGHLSLEKVTDVLGLTDRRMIVDTIEGLINRDQKLVTKVIQKLFSSGYDPIIYMRDLLEELRHLLLVKIAPNEATGLVDLANEEIDLLKKMSQALSEEDVHLLFDMGLKGAADIHRAPDTRVVLEMVLLRMSLAPRVQDLAKALSSGQFTVAAESPLVSQPANSPTAVKGAKIADHLAALSNAAQPKTPRATPTANQSAPNSYVPTPPPRVQEAPGVSRWMDLVEKIKHVNPTVAAKIEHLHVLELTGDKLELGIPEKYKFLTAQVAEPAFMRKMTNYISTFWGQTLTVTFKELSDATTTTQSANQVAQKKSAADKQQLEEDVENHPLVKSAKNIFGTKITSIKERR